MNLKARIVFLFLPVCATLPAQALNWPLDQRPRGVAPAEFPVARNDWMMKFQSHLDRAARGGVDLLFVGDSITEGWKYDSGGRPVLEREFGGERAVSFGVAGDRTENILWRLRNGELAGVAPRLIVIMAGTNNVARDTPAEIAGGVGAIVAECRRACPSSHILLLGVFPRGESPDNPHRLKLDEVNRLIAPLGYGEQVTFLDIGRVFLRDDGALRRELMPDLLHPNRAGYEAWAEAIRPVVRARAPAR